MQKVVADTVGIFAGLPLREHPDEPNDQPEAVTVIVMNYDGVSPAQLVDYLPTGSPVHYDTFIRRIGKLYTERFSGQK